MDLAGCMTALDLVLDQWVTSQDQYMIVLVGMITIALDQALTMALAGGMTTPAQDMAQ